MKNIFDSEITNEVIERINQLTPSSQPSWGKMNVSEMLAHCCVSYEYVFNQNKFSKPKGIKKLLLKMIVKGVVVSDKPYKKNSRTAPDFLITEEKEFDTEKKRLIDFLNQTQELGESHFNNKESHSFGPLTSNEWNNMFYKHLDHHLTQFNV